MQNQNQGRGPQRGGFRGRGDHRGRGGQGHARARTAEHGGRDNAGHRAHSARGYRGSRGRGGGRGARGHSRGHSRTPDERQFPMGHRELQQLCEKDDPGEILARLTNPMSGFTQLLQSHEEKPAVVIELVTTVVQKVVKYKGSPESVLMLLNDFKDSMLVKIHLNMFFTTLSFTHEWSKLRMYEKVARNVLDIFQVMLRRIPSCACEVQVVVTGLQASTQRLCLGNEDLLVNPAQLQEAVNDVMSTCEKSMRTGRHRAADKNAQRAQLEDNETPPENFREISVIPTVDDVHAAEVPFLRTNKATGAYRDLEHYLDVQFRLLREDFVRPLREGITHYMQTIRDRTRAARNTDIRVYEGVQVLYPVCTNTGVCYRIRFDISRLRRVKWEASKRLIFGSLLCLSKDNFETLLFASVKDRDPKLLVRGEIDVQFEQENGSPNQMQASRDVFTMAETTAFFEAYRHVLEGLKTIDENFPFQKYLVDAETAVEAPMFLRQNRAAKFNLSMLCTDDDDVTADAIGDAVDRLRLSDSDSDDNEENIAGLTALQRMRLRVQRERHARAKRERERVTTQANRAASSRATAVELLRPGSWPPAADLKLDHTQYDAMIAALTKELVIIQGPPGTGKTYVGLKIVRGLISNEEVWNKPAEQRNPAVAPLMAAALGAGRDGAAARADEMRHHPGLGDNRGHKTPILVVCYTNHALDQFLEGISGFLGHGIVRVGGRSRSEAMDKFNLRSLRQDHRASRRVAANIFHAKRTARDAMEAIEGDLTRVGVQLDYSERQLIHEDYLQDFISERHYKQLKDFYNDNFLEIPAEFRRHIKRKSMIIEWLGLGDMLLPTNVEQNQHEVRANGAGAPNAAAAAAALGAPADAEAGDNEGVEADADEELIDVAGDAEIAEDARVLDVEDEDDAARRRRRHHERVRPHLLGVGEQLAVNLDAMMQQLDQEEEEQLQAQQQQVREDLERRQQQQPQNQQRNRGNQQRNRENQRRNQGNQQQNQQAPLDAEAQQALAAVAEGFQLQRRERRRRFELVKRNLRSTNVMTDEQAQNIDNLWALSAQQKWRLYRNWVAKYKARLLDGVHEKQAAYQREATRLRELSLEEDKSIMQDGIVLGMTTTGAARYRNILQAIQPRIVVVEEAAEVLESHIIATISDGCEHLILIGDHKQLRPNPTVYELAERYQLKISLFERLINNGLSCVTLGEQHRMRPEISRMMTHIYPNLRDHSSVMSYDNVKGVSKNFYFLHHEEQEDADDELKSKSNYHEAQFVAALCHYLLQHEYKPDQITVLTPYAGQVFELRRAMPKRKFEGVRITAIDNFQGEENDIILLSLVRSNEARKAGFLKEDNRLCVALSRARMGLYVIGNFRLLADSSRLWSKVIQTVKDDGCYGDELQLYCQNHPQDGGAKVRSADDFRAVPEGGCTKPCEFRLKCGHVCVRMCHPYDTEHKEYECQKPCDKKLCDMDGHKCRKPCFQDCGQCMTPVSRVLPTCGHNQQVPCSVKVHEYRCRAKCDKKLPCGHPCTNPCSEKCTTQCEVKVERSLPCGHDRMLRCFEEPLARKCNKACGVVLECGHPCTGFCGLCLQGRVHQGCTARCGRVLVCGHECTTGCTRECPPCTKWCENRCAHSRCAGKRCGELCTPCKEPCEWVCQHKRCTKLCHEPCDRTRCDEPCQWLLMPCRHQCIGLCGEVCPKKCRICNRDDVTEIFFGTEDEPHARFVELQDCGHVFEVSGLDRWMDMRTDSESGEVSIQLKACPRCKTVIRKNLRYGPIINQILNDIEMVKQRIVGQTGDALTERKQQVRVRLADVRNKDQFSVAKPMLTRLDYERITSGEVECIDFASQILERICDVRERLVKAISVTRARTAVEGSTDMLAKRLYEDMASFATWLGTNRYAFCEQEARDANQEVTRMSLCVDAVSLRVKVVSSVTSSKLYTVLPKVNKALDVFQTGKRLTNTEIEHVKQTLTELSRELFVPGLGISNDERKEIVRAVGLKQGHWFKCPNGHPYAIGECGGATMESRCPECNATIGGQGHRLTTGNQVATEMDGARHGAFSAAANELHGFLLREDIQ